MAGRVSNDAFRVDVEGLAELSKDLRALDKNLARELRAANKSVAGFVASDARAAALSLGGVAAHSAPSVKPAAGGDWAGVALGNDSYPMAAGAEFGGQRRPTTQQFQPWRGSDSSAGYFLYPSIRNDSDRIETEYTAALDEVLRKADLA